jgi:lysine 2,3-aminomutase
VYPEYKEKDSTFGLSGLFNDHHFNLVPEGLNRLQRRIEYSENPEQSSLKDKRDKRDQLKEKKYLAEQMKQQSNKECGE